MAVRLDRAVFPPAPAAPPPSVPLLPSSRRRLSSRMRRRRAFSSSAVEASMGSTWPAPGDGSEVYMLWARRGGIFKPSGNKAVVDLDRGPSLSVERTVWAALCWRRASANDASAPVVAACSCCCWRCMGEPAPVPAVAVLPSLPAAWASSAGVEKESRSALRRSNSASCRST